MTVLKPRYGLDGNAINTLNARWRKLKLDQEGWASFDQFLHWSSIEGWRPHCHLRKINEQKPHGMYNSFWEAPGGGNHGMFQNDSPCRSCDPEIAENCVRPCKARLDFWDQKMEDLRRRFGL